MKAAPLVCGLSHYLSGKHAQDAARPAHLDTSKPTEQRIADLISRMTLEEKAQQLNHLNVGIPASRLQRGVDGTRPCTVYGRNSRRCDFRLRTHIEAR